MTGSGGNSIEERLDLGGPFPADEAAHLGASAEPDECRCACDSMGSGPSSRRSDIDQLETGSPGPCGRCYQIREHGSAMTAPRRREGHDDSVVVAHRARGTCR